MYMELQTKGTFGYANKDTAIISYCVVNPNQKQQHYPLTQWGFLLGVDPLQFSNINNSFPLVVQVWR